MSDTLQEGEDQKVEWHEFTPDSNYSIRMCAICGFGEEGHNKYFPPHDQNTRLVGSPNENADWCDDCHGYTHMPWCPAYVSADRCPQCGGLNTSRGKTRLWCNDCQRHTWAYGSYEPDKEVVDQTATTTPQPAARGGGDVWDIESDSLLGRRRIRDMNTNRIVAVAASDDDAQQILREHNQHQSLVAERERLRAAIEVAIHNLNAGNDPKFLADYLRLILDQQRSTSE